FEFFKQPVRLVLGKSLVKSATTGDVFEGVDPAAILYSAVRGYQPERRDGLSLELGGPWAFYREFWKAHNLEHLARLLPAPEVGVQTGETLHAPLLIRNDSADPAEVTLTAALPQGWTERTGAARYPVAAHDVYPVQARPAQLQSLRITVGRSLSRTLLRTLVLAAALVLGSARGWSQAGIKVVPDQTSYNVGSAVHIRLVEPAPGADAQRRTGVARELVATIRYAGESRPVAEGLRLPASLLLSSTKDSPEYFNL